MNKGVVYSRQSLMTYNRIFDSVFFIPSYINLRGEDEDKKDYYDNIGDCHHWTYKCL